MPVCSSFTLQHLNDGFIIRLCQRFHHLPGIIAGIHHFENVFVVHFNDVYQCLDHKILLRGDSSVDQRLVLRRMVIFPVFRNPVGEELEQDNGGDIEFLHQ